LATHKSALKRARQAEKRAVAKKSLKSRIHTVEVRFRALLAAGKKEEAMKMLPAVMGEIDRAWSAGVFPRETASRKIARLSRALGK
jgi:small subunit ribosomal protein S20